jgi:predicted transposase YbfD/YdcC
LCAVICGADSWEDIEEFGNTKREWFETFLELPHGIPAHDTFGRIFASMDSKEFQDSFLKWVKAIQKTTRNRIVAIDGKTLRRSYEKDKLPLHMVSAWSCEDKMVLGQVKTREKSNEITAIPAYFEDCRASGFKDTAYDYHETIDGDHGRIETRRYWTTSDVDWLTGKTLWKNLSTIAWCSGNAMWRVSQKHATASRVSPVTPHRLAGR